MDGIDSPSIENSTLKKLYKFRMRRRKRGQSMRKTLIANLWFSPRLNNNNLCKRNILVVFESVGKWNVDKTRTHFFYHSVPPLIVFQLIKCLFGGVHTDVFDSSRYDISL